MEFGLSKKLTMCAAKCSATENCTSFFYNKQTTTCKGAPGMITSAVGCEDVIKTVYYKNEDYGSYGSNCDVSECMMTNSMCLEGVCSYQPGYKYNRTSGFCVTNCTLYGVTYIEYRDRIFNEALIATYSGLSLEMCKANCSETSACRSIGHGPVTGLCKLRPSTPLEYPAAFKTYQGANYYTRNCG
ncbi:uncharacterized protein LOC132712710 [Ruditapes philippinarum]|uniref:uncharacterized protein LOC132712710 n=1 Tax=Ruditapes philippinarum TaxID=129788 RepID=UPI00295C00AB|nr:uncharacterized protein LOC132712710 [Ruditapes philippinarum]